MFNPNSLLAYHEMLDASAPSGYGSMSLLGMSLPPAQPTPQHYFGKGANPLHDFYGQQPQQGVPQWMRPNPYIRQRFPSQRRSYRNQVWGRGTPRRQPIQPNWMGWQ
jgi:hypothetical protein